MGSNAWNMHRFSVLALLSLLLASSCAVEAATKRAVVIGINQYTLAGAPPLSRGEPASPLLWLDLRGAVNDAQRIRDLLMARYGFKRDDILFLTDSQASRAAILKAIDTQLIAPSKRGDVAFFYFAGHGSRVRNTLAAESDKLDESIVPADVASGVRDIRDKELRVAFNKVLDKGASLVAVFDSCHSGSITRGLAGDAPYRTRLLPIDPRDVKDASVAPNPWERGALILSAAQNDQLASEDEDEYGYPGGRFSIQFAKLARSAPMDEPVELLFRRVQGAMRSRGTVQEPVLEGTSSRKRQALLGGSARDEVPIAAAVERVNGTMVTLQEGLGMGLTVRSELSKVGEPGTKLRIERVDGISRSFARVIAGAHDSIRPGDLFLLDRAPPPDVPNLRVWVPTAALSSAQLTALHDELRAAVRAKGHAWIDDPVSESPTHVVLFSEKRWWLYAPTGAPVSLGESVSGSSLTARLTASDRTPTKVYLMLPASAQLDASLAVGAKSSNNAIERAEPAKADYYLMGSVREGRLSYAWVRPWLAVAQASTMPMRTDWLDATRAQVAAELSQFAVKLGFINAWLTLEGAPAAKPFPYRLVLRNAATGKYVDSGVVTAGQSFELALVSDRQNLSRDAWCYVYVYGLDSFGNMTLLFPRAAAAENRFPPEHDAQPRQTYVLDGSQFDIGPPFGTDTYILITSSEQTSDPSRLESSGVRTRSATVVGSIFDMLAEVGARTRAPNPQPVPSQWSIDRISLISQQQAE